MMLYIVHLSSGEPYKVAISCFILEMKKGVLREVVRKLHTKLRSVGLQIPLLLHLSIILLVPFSNHLSDMYYLPTIA